MSANVANAEHGRDEREHDRFACLKRGEQSFLQCPLDAEKAARAVRDQRDREGCEAGAQELEWPARREREGGLSVEDAMRQAAAGTALGRMVAEQDVASAALFLASDLSAGITGASACRWRIALIALNSSV